MSEENKKVNDNKNNNAEKDKRNGTITEPGKKPEDQRTKKETEKLTDQKINEYGQTTLENNNKRIHLMTIIGEVEGHECLPQHNKTTKYEHLLPQLASIEDSKEIEGVLILINTVGGDVEAGLAIAEMIASLSKPTVTLVLGGSHSIGVPLAVSSDYSFIVPTATMIIHPVRMNGMVIGVSQMFEYFEQIQDRIISFVSTHSNISYEDFRKLMLNTTQLVKDVGSILIGKETVEKGIIDEVGGIDKALKKLNSMIDENKQQNNQAQQNDQQNCQNEQENEQGNTEPQIEG
ncbi:MAG: ATP-dependent Clp protease proteolytic subunit [bacterium]|nr:ATP-dependent Clp protease proteolytic subunit [bacterium]